MSLLELPDLSPVSLIYLECLFLVSLFVFVLVFFFVYYFCWRCLCCELCGYTQVLFWHVHPDDVLYTSVVIALAYRQTLCHQGIEVRHVVSFSPRFEEVYLKTESQRPFIFFFSKVSRNLGA